MTSPKMWLTESGQKIFFKLIQSQRARRVYLKISVSKGLEIILPKRFSLQKLPEILREKETWIVKNLQKVNEREAVKAKLKFEEDANISILGIQKNIRFYTTNQKRSYVEETENELKIFKSAAQVAASENIKLLKNLSIPSPHPPSLGDFTEMKLSKSKFFLNSKKKDLENTSNSSTHPYKNILEKYLQTKAKIYFLKRVPELATRMALDYRRISVRAQKSRWGSCSRKKDLSFNWRLILTPPEVADYVIVHELAHTVHLNHSKHFYAVVEQFCPDYKQLRAFLRKVEFAI